MTWDIPGRSIRRVSYTFVGIAGCARFREVYTDKQGIAPIAYHATVMYSRYTV